MINLLPGSHVYVEREDIRTSSKCLRSRDRSIADERRSGKKNSLRLFRPNLFDSSISLSHALRAESTRLRCASFSLSILKTTVLKNYVSHRRNHCTILRRRRVWYPLLYLLYERRTGPAMQGSIDRLIAHIGRLVYYRRGRETISLTGSFASHNQSAKRRSPIYLSRYVSQ